MNGSSDRAQICLKTFVMDLAMELSMVDGFEGDSFLGKEACNPHFSAIFEL